MDYYPFLAERKYLKFFRKMVQKGLNVFKTN